MMVWFDRRLKQLEDENTRWGNGAALLSDTPRSAARATVVVPSNLMVSSNRSRG